MTKFLTLNAGGRVTNVREIPQAAMLACPHCIMVADHYRKDNTCRCNDASHTEMTEWGYVWKDGQWRSP